MGLIGSHETLVLNQPVLHNNPEGGKIQFDCSGRLQSRDRNLCISYTSQTDKCEVLQVHKELVTRQFLGACCCTVLV
jgi:hypothetical protein